MRILYFSDNSSDHNLRFLEKFVSEGLEVIFLDATQGAKPVRSLPAGVASVSFKRCVPRDANPSQYEGIVSELRFLLRDVRPDVVHAGPVQTCGYAAALSGFHPLLIMPWGSDLIAYADRNPEWMHATEIALRAADGFFPDCNAVRAAGERFVTFANEKIVQFPWGIRSGSFSPLGPAVSRESLGFGSDSFTFISTRSWEPIYDIHVLLQAFHQAWQQNELLRLILLGDGSEAEWVRRFIAEHDLGSVVATPGLIPAAEMPRWFRSANAYVSCTRSDGTSISLLQAMATGLPAIVTDIPSNREWVTENMNGWLASVGSAEEFAEKLLRAADLESGDREAIAERNQNIVAERADWDRNFPGLLRLYENLVSSAVEIKV
ncbi:MAG TPA: glycosyltransferase family 4 protein [Terriglobales bacterium]|nr:glycosyltransferase family 4 protein [Terriglobales bacterium]